MSGADASISVGQHRQWTVLGATFNIDTVLSTLLSAGIVLAFAWRVRSSALAAERLGRVPGGAQLAFEVVTVAIEEQVERSLGIRTAPFVAPLSIALFFFILIANWLALLPHAFDEYLRPPTADINLTLALAVFVIILVHLTGVRTKGARRYAAHFAKPYAAMLPFEIIMEITKPIGLALRLFGNILAGTVMVSMLSLLPVAVAWLPTAAWKLFEIFVGLLQAVIFVVLTIIYFGQAAGQEVAEMS